MRLVLLALLVAVLAPAPASAGPRMWIGFQDDISATGTLFIDDFYTGLKDGRTIAFGAPPAYDPRPHAPRGFSPIFDDDDWDMNRE